MGQNLRYRIKYVFTNTSAKEEKEPPQEHQGEVSTCHLCKVTPSLSQRRHLPNNVRQLRN